MRSLVLVLLVACGSHVQTPRDLRWRALTDLRWHHLRALRWAMRDDDQPSRVSHRALGADLFKPNIIALPTPSPDPIVIDYYWSPLDDGL